MITSSHPEWPEFREKHIDEPMRRAMIELCDANLSAEQTAMLRGRIAALKALREDIEPNAPEVIPSPTYR